MDALRGQNKNQNAKEAQESVRRMTEYSRLKNNAKAGGGCLVMLMSGLIIAVAVIVVFLGLL